MSGRGTQRVSLPPPMFVGREGDLQVARAALARRSVLVVYGLGGIGKSAFLRALVTSGQRATAVEVRAERGAGLREIAEPLRTAWAPDQPSSPDEAALASVLVDLADDRGATILLDDAHELAPGSLDLLLRAFSGYATASTLLVSTRLRPDLPDLGEQLLHLRPLDVESTALLVRGCCPGVSDEACASIVARSAGSPWMARCLAAGQLDPSNRLVAGLDEPLQRGVEALRWLDVPVVEELVDAVSGRPGAARELVARSFAERIGPRVRLHDVARQSLDELGSADRAAATLALAYAVQRDSAEDACTALALAVALDERTEVSRIVRERGADMVAQGFAATAWRALSPLPTTEELAFRLECAAQAGTRQTVEWARRLPAPSSPRLALAWATCMEACGQGDDARATMMAVARNAEPDLAVQAAAFVAMISRTEEGAREVLELLRRPGLFDGQPGVLRFALEALGLLWSGQSEKAIRRLHEALEAPAADSPHLRPAMFTLFQLCVFLGYQVGANAVLLRLPALVDDSGMSFRELYVHAIHALDRGDLGTARRQAEKMSRRPLRDKDFYLLDLVRFRIALSTGETDAALGLLREVEELAIGWRSPEPTAWLRSAELSIAIAEDRAPRPWEWPADVPTPGPPVAAWLEIAERRARCRSGEEVEFLDLEIPSTSIKLRALHAQLEAECRAARGDLDGARRTLDGALGMARTHGLRYVELELLSTRGRLLRQSGDQEGADRVGAELEVIADQTGYLAFRVIGRRLRGMPTADDAAPARGLRMDAAHRVVHLGPERTVSLDSLPIGFRLLDELVAAGGSATKERLVRAVWDRKRYDPQRDDKRLQMAVRRLRVLIEHDPGLPRWLLTTRDGYAIGDPDASTRQAPTRRA